MIAVYLLAGGIGVARALFRDPFLDPYCWRNCVANSFLLRSDTETTRVVDRVSTGVLLVLG